MRLGILIVVVAAHIALLALLPYAYRTAPRTYTAASKSELVFISISEPAEPPAAQVPEVEKAVGGSRLAVGKKSVDSFPPEPPTANRQPQIDWSHEAAVSAARQIEADERARREARMFSGIPHALSEEGWRPAPEFGWSHSAIHRIEPVDGGGFLIWINDRCAIFVGVVAMPFCKLGKKPPRGDLFEHMADAPRAGDWKD